MSTSFYVYETLDEYKRLNKQFVNNPLYHTKLIDMYIIPNLKIILITHTNDQKERINLTKTTIHARNGFLPDELKHAQIVNYGKIFFDVKKSKLLINPKFLRKAQYIQKVDRYFGERTTGKQKINYEFRFYDFVRDRVSLVLL